MSSSINDSPGGTSSAPTGPAVETWVLRRTGSKLFQTRTYYKAQVLFLTYIAFASYHLSRRPLTIVKSVLHHHSCAEVPVPGGTIITKDNVTTWCDWHRE